MDKLTVFNVLHSSEVVDNKQRWKYTIQCQKLLLRKKKTKLVNLKWNVVKVIVAQSCLTLWDPMDYSPPGSSVHGIFQVRKLEWVAISFSRGSSWSRDQTQGSNLLHCRRILYCLSHEGSPKASSNYLWSDEVRVIYPSQWEMKHRLSYQTKEHRELL